jgi:3-phenylpropionate/trans-cinnamate dioxygenase ferredoxin reductase component
MRRVEDSERIKAGFARARRVAIVGGGWIGLETASSGSASNASRPA